MGWEYNIFWCKQSMANSLNKFVDRALDLGVTYLDIRLEKYDAESVIAEDGKPKEATFSTELGVGVRALAGGS
ncbi:MAG: DNA gyrase modulator [Candidatus Bathyarchaeota archaeon]